MIRIILFTLMVFTLSCANKEKNQKDFQIVRKVSFHPLKIDPEQLYQPIFFVALSNYLVVIDHGNGKLVSIIDIKKEAVIRRVFSNGKGPNEFPTGLSFIRRYGNNAIQVYNPNEKNFLIFPIDSLVFSTLQPLERYETNNNFSLQKNEVIKGLCCVNDSLFIASGSFLSSRFLFLNKLHNGIFEGLYKYDYPEDTRKEHKGENNYLKSEAYQGIFSLSPDMSKAIYTSSSCHSYIAFEINGSQINRKFEVIHNLPDYVSDGYNVAVFSHKNGNGYFGDAGNNYFYLNFMTRSMQEYKEDYNVTDEIHIYSWENENYMKLKLDRFIGCMSVDETNRRIYAISENPITFYPEIGYFEF